MRLVLGSGPAIGASHEEIRAGIERDGYFILS
jgi:hypothetical protein